MSECESCPMWVLSMGRAMYVVAAVRPQWRVLRFFCPPPAFLLAVLAATLRGSCGGGEAGGSVTPPSALLL